MLNTYSELLSLWFMKTAITIFQYAIHKNNIEYFIKIVEFHEKFNPIYASMRTSKKT